MDLNLPTMLESGMLILGLGAGLWLGWWSDHHNVKPSFDPPRYLEVKDKFKRTTEEVSVVDGKVQGPQGLGEEGENGEG